MVFLFSVFAIVINTARGVKEVDPELIEVARSYLAGEVVDRGPIRQVVQSLGTVTGDPRWH